MTFFSFSLKIFGGFYVYFRVYFLESTLIVVLRVVWNVRSSLNLLYKVHHFLFFDGRLLRYGSFPWKAFTYSLSGRVFPFSTLPNSGDLTGMVFTNSFSMWTFTFLLSVVILLRICIFWVTISFVFFIIFLSWLYHGDVF